MHRWTAVMDASARAAFVASAQAAPAMIARQTGLIVNISFWAAQRHLGNMIYGVSKAATDKLTCRHGPGTAPAWGRGTESVLTAAAQVVLKLGLTDTQGKQPRPLTLEML